MGNYRKYQMNDAGMYEYFDRLIYGENNARIAAWKFKSSESGYGFTERNVEMLLGSKSVLYGREDAEKQICLLEALETFLHEYVGIEGLEELFINNYGVIENSIFLEHDAQGHSKNVREHAKHQMKNAYLGSVFLLECNYLENVAQHLYQAQGRAALYLKNEAQRAVIRKEDDGKEKEEQVLEKLKELAYKIFMVASLLHDIGYPLEYYLRSARQMTDYPPYLKLLSPMVKTEFAELKAYLLDSKLFQLIDQKEIAGKYAADNHGVLSALSLLLHFYHNGRIYALNPEQRCIIEMAAIAIYRHTDRFPEGERMVYMTDPISYMVRLCDDMQEWERFRTDISEKHNYLQCGSCGRKISATEERVYRCECGQEYQKITMINNRKLNYVCLCDELIVEASSEVKVTAQFHLMKQIEILLDDYKAVCKSKKDLESVQKLLQEQSMRPRMTVDFFLSNNPVMLIERMLQQGGKTVEEIEAWIENEVEGEARKQALQEFWTDFKRLRVQNPFGQQVENNELKYGGKAKKFVLKYYGQIFSLYEKCSMEAR